MLILTIRTDNPKAEIGLYEDSIQLAYYTWEAHRSLAETLQIKIDELLKSKHKHLDALNGVVIYKGPGSFTGLRIGLSLANALAFSLNVPIVASSGNDWLAHGQEQLMSGKNERIALPDYGGEPHITLPKH